jgi:predicted aspartyl protease
LRLLALLGVLAVLPSACGPKAPPALAHDVGLPGADAGPTEPAPPPEKRRCDLDYVLKGNPFASPVVRATVGGVETTMLLDTGANTHMLTGWIARKAHLETKALGDSGTDHTGKTIKARRVDHANVALEGWGPIEDRPILVVDVPDRLEQLGIGGFISPQQLATDDQPVVLDLERAEMRTAKKEEVEALPGRTLGRGAARVCSDQDSHIGRTLAFVVKGSIDAHDVELLVDTGAPMTDLLATSAPGKALGPKTVENKDEIYAASGKVKPRVFKNGKLVLGEVEVTVDVNVLAGANDPFCPRDGVVAMDVLRRCVLVFGPASMTGTCKAK